MIIPTVQMKNRKKSASIKQFTVISEEIIRQGKQNNENMEVYKEHKE